jgi:hypothetical protein
MSPVAGDAIVATSVGETRDNRGIRRPLLVDVTSNCADAFGLEIPIPTLCAKEELMVQLATRQKINFIMQVLF